MAWVEVNSHLDDSYGYFHGTGKDAGYYCFQRSEDSSSEDNWIVAETFDPYYKATPFGNFYVEPYTYNENPVFRNTSKDWYIFKSKGPGENWIMLSSIKEPICYYDIDLSTMLGDGWYELHNPPSFELTSFSNTTFAVGKGVWENADYINLTNEYKCYEFQPHHGWWWDPSDEIPYGRYEDEEGHWKVVGNPVWKTYSQDSGMNNLQVDFLYRDDNDNPVYRVGSKTLSAYPEEHVLAIGHLSVGRWYEGTAFPSPDTGSTVRYQGYEMQNGAKTEIPSSYVEINYSHTGRGAMSALIYMGEVAQWH